MTTLYVQYCTRNKLPCTFVENAPVVLCLQDSALVAPTACPSFSEGEYVGAFMEATICSGYSTSEGCGSTRWVYTLAYSNEQLADALVPLTTGDIAGVFCRDCLTAYLDYKIGSEVYVDADESNDLFLVSQHGCTYPIIPRTNIVSGLVSTAVDTDIRGQMVKLTEIGLSPGIYLVNYTVNWGMDTGSSVHNNEFEDATIYLKKASEALPGGIVDNSNSISQVLNATSATAKTYTNYSKTIPVVLTLDPLETLELWIGVLGIATDSTKLATAYGAGGINGCTISYIKLVDL
jgi:hypothetical protein